MSSLNLTTNKEVAPNTQIIHFSGAFDGGAKESVDQIQLILSDIQVTRFIFDFKDLSYLNSYAIGTLISWQNDLKKNGKAIVLVNVNEHVADILSIIGASGLFDVYPDIDTALNI